MKTRQYWFEPKRFGIVAGYYPVTRAGWIVTLVTIIVLATIFVAVDQHSHSVSDTLIGIVLPWLVVLLIFDIISFRTGRYPSWWKRYGKEKT